jgi:hypothetical protein
MSLENTSAGRLGIDNKKSNSILPVDPLYITSG